MGSGTRKVGTARTTHMLIAVGLTKIQKEETTEEE